jgi:large subunit ribosomal protein L29
MAKFKIKNVEELGAEDLDKRLTELRLSLLKQRAQIAKGAQLENPKMVREIRKNIARILHKKKENESKKTTETVPKKTKRKKE